MLNLVRILSFSWMVSCSDAIDLPIAEKGYSLQLMVSTGNMGGNLESGTQEEQAIHSIYIYAYDDNYQTHLPDFYEDNNVDEPYGGTYAFDMKVYDAGTKRFYVFVNPPEYIRSELVYNADEQKLKNLAIYQSKPLKKISDLQQTVDGRTERNGGQSEKIGNKIGLPMGNFFEARVGFEDGNSNQLWLYPLDVSGTKIQSSIPLYRSMGKMTIRARMKKIGKSKNNLSITQIKMFNYTINGFYLPKWQTKNGECYWKQTGSVFWGWNQDLKMDLNQLVKQENAVMDQPEDLLKTPVLIDSEEFKKMTSFYLCQNSYGPDTKISGDWNGLEDPVGNRITKLSVTMNDGRKTEIALPFLCRNDHLIVNLTITLQGILVNFEKWKETTVHPDWEDEVVSESAPQENKIL